MFCHDTPCQAPLRLPCRRAARLHPACRSSIAFRSVCTAAGVPAVRPFFARIACAHAPAFAPARFARLIAHARGNAGRTSPVRSVGFFRTGARQETKRLPDAASSPASFYHGFTGVKPSSGISSYFMNKLSSSVMAPTLPFATRPAPTASSPPAPPRPRAPGRAAGSRHPPLPGRGTRKRHEMSCSVTIRRAPGLLCGGETARNAASRKQLTTPFPVSSLHCPGASGRAALSGGADHDNGEKSGLVLRGAKEPCCR